MRGADKNNGEGRNFPKRGVVVPLLTFTEGALQLALSTSIEFFEGFLNERLVFALESQLCHQVI